MSSQYSLNPVYLNLINQNSPDPSITLDVPDACEVDAVLLEIESVFSSDLSMADKYKTLFLTPWLSAMKNYLWFLPTPTSEGRWILAGVYRTCFNFAIQKYMNMKPLVTKRIDSTLHNELVELAFFMYCFIRKACELVPQIQVATDKSEWCYLGFSLSYWIQSEQPKALSVSVRPVDRRRPELGLGAAIGEIYPIKLLSYIRERGDYVLEHELLGASSMTDQDEIFLKLYLKG